MDAAIIGAGVVGTGMSRIFPDALLVDSKPGFFSVSDVHSDLAIVCVPTPSKPDGSCDTSIVESVVREVDAKLILIKSTVAPGTTDRLRETTGKRVLFSPEYMGESKYWTPPEFPDPTNPISHGFMVIGGPLEDCSRVADCFLPRLGPATRFRFMSSLEAELVKYAENTFFSTKVTFANELRRLCEKAGANYHQVREGWLDDPRIGPMFSAAFKDSRGFSGKCLPKDTQALANYSRSLGLDPVLLDAVLKINQG